MFVNQLVVKEKNVLLFVHIQNVTGVENVARLVPSSKNGEFRLVCCIVNQSAFESRCQRILSGSKTMILSPYSNFLYEVSLYLKIRVSELKTLFGNDCEYLHSLCDKVYKRFRKRFRKNCRKSGLATYISGENLRKCFSRYRYAWSNLTETIYRKQNDSGISLLWNCCVNVRVLYPTKKWEKGNMKLIYCIKTKDLL